MTGRRALEPLRAAAPGVRALRLIPQSRRPCRTTRFFSSSVTRSASTSPRAVGSECWRRGAAPSSRSTGARSR